MRIVAGALDLTRRPAMAEQQAHQPAHAGRYAEVGRALIPWPVWCSDSFGPSPLVIGPHPARQTHPSVFPLLHHDRPLARLDRERIEEMYRHAELACQGSGDDLRPPGAAGERPGLWAAEQAANSRGVAGLSRAGTAGPCFLTW